MLLRKVFPRQENFFSCFCQLALHVNQAAGLFKSLVADTSQAADYAKRIAQIEADGDAVAQNAYDVLHQTFITPFDRHDILELLGKLDDILDLINRCAKRIAVFKILQISLQIQDIVNLTFSASEKIIFIMKKLNNLKNSKEILHACRELSDLERQADYYKMSGMQALLENENDFKQFFKMKELYDYSKSIVSECHHLANIVKGIVLEYS